MKMWPILKIITTRKSSFYKYYVAIFGTAGGANNDDKGHDYADDDDYADADADADDYTGDNDYTADDDYVGDEYYVTEAPQSQGSSLHLREPPVPHCITISNPTFFHPNFFQSLSFDG